MSALHAGPGPTLPLPGSRDPATDGIGRATRLMSAGGEGKAKIHSLFCRCITVLDFPASSRSTVNDSGQGSALGETPAAGTANS